MQAGAISSMQPVCSGSPFKPGSILVAALPFPRRLMSCFSKFETESHGSS